MKSFTSIRIQYSYVFDIFKQFFFDAINSEKKMLNFRCTKRLNNIYEILIMTVLIWSLLNICVSLLMLQIQLVSLIRHFSRQMLDIFYIEIPFQF